MEEEINLSLEDMKRLSHEIIEEELSQYGVKLNVFPLTFIEYYNRYVFKQKIKLIKKISMLTLPIVSGGFNDLKGNTVIFLNHINKIENIEYRIFRLALVCYHEVRHSIQQTFDDYSYDGFLRDIDEFLYVKFDYRLEHDNYSFEIGANLYGIRKAKEFLKRRYPKIYESYKEGIEKTEERYEIDYMSYDPSDSVERMIQKLRKNNENNKTKKYTILNDISPVLGIFLNENGSFKEISAILQNEKFKELDKRIIYAFFSSKSFLEQLNMEQLRTEELEVINETLQYTSNLYKKQSELLDKKLRESQYAYLEYIESQASLLNKIYMIDSYCTRKTLDALNFARSEKKRKTHMKHVPTYLEKSQRFLEQRKNNGYLSPTMFYIMGMIISLATIIYILILR